MDNIPSEIKARIAAKSSGFEFFRMLDVKTDAIPSEIKLNAIGQFESLTTHVGVNNDGESSIHEGKENISGSLKYQSITRMNEKNDPPTAISQ